MKKAFSIVLILAIILLGGCRGGEQASVAGELPTAPPEEASAVSAEAEEAEEPIVSAESKTEADIYAQDTFTAPAEIHLKTDGTFMFKVIMYDGHPEVSGTFSDTGIEFILTPESSTAANIVPADIGEIRLEKSGVDLIYHGSALGETSEGAVFKPKLTE